MFEIGWSELLVIAVVAIIVVGPKDLPRMLRTFGGFVGKARRMAFDFQRQFNDVLKEAERQADLEDVRKQIADVKAMNPLQDVKNTIADVKSGFELPASAPAQPKAETVVPPTSAAPAESALPAQTAPSSDEPVAMTPPPSSEAPVEAAPAPQAGSGVASPIYTAPVAAAPAAAAEPVPAEVEAPKPEAANAEPMKLTGDSRP